MLLMNARNGALYFEILRNPMNCSEVQQLHCSTKLFQFSISLICLILFDMITNPSGLCLCKLQPYAIGTMFLLQLIRLSLP